MTIVPPTIALELGIVRTALENDYEVLEELGRGGMAIVYRATDKQIDREVAIKVLPFSLAFDGDFVERFQHEARTAGQLEHPNIVPIYRVGRSGQVIFFVMKFLRGQSLASALRERTKLDVPEVRKIILDVAAALGHAAKAGVVHRDIKPDNILFDQEGRCVVTDFGIAKTSGKNITAQGTSMGTPRYMSPEHAQGQPLNGRSDIYSLGVVAYQCLTGVVPFDGDDPFAVLYKHINNSLPTPQLATTEQKTLFAVIQKMLAKRPENRFQDADELILALGGEVSQPVLVGPTLTATLANKHRRLTPTEIIATPISGRIWAFLPRRQRRLIMLGAAALATFGLYTYNKSRTAGAQQPVAAVDSMPMVSITPGSIREAPAPAPPPEPFSRCARVDSATAARRNVMALMLDSLRDQPPNAKLAFNYDVCGLAKNSPYTADVEVRKVNESRLRRIVGGAVKPVAMNFLDVVDGPRTRRRRIVDLAGLPPGRYELDVVIVDHKNRREERSRPFRILER
jgi:predicted Ser/Thr protein kinase